MRRALPLLLLLGGCGQDVCGDFPGRACIALEVDAPADAPGARVDQLRLDSVALALGGALTPTPARSRPAELPIHVAVVPHDPAVSVEADLVVTGLVGGASIGTDRVVATLHHGEHLRMTARLVVGDAVEPDGGVDQAGADLAGADLAGADLRGVDLSTTPPAHVQPAQSGLVGGPVTVLAAAADGSLFAGTAGGGIFHASDGASWQAVNTGLTELGIQHLAADPTAAGTLYADSFNLFPPKIFRTTDGGAHWSVLDLPPAVTGFMGPIAVDPGSGKPIFEYAGDVYRADDGVHFALVNGASPLPKTGSSTDTIAQLLFTQAGHVLAIAASGVFRSTDGGATWAAATAGLPSPRGFINRVGRDPTTGTLYLPTIASPAQCFHSTDDGQSWSSISGTGLPSAGAINFVDDGTSLYSFDSASGGTSGVVRSSDGGGSFADFTSGLPVRELEDLLALPGPRTFAAPRDTGVFASTGGGWSPASSGLHAVQISSFAVDPTRPQTVYAGGIGAVWKSIDGGASWAAHPNGLPLEAVLSLAVDPDAPTRVYAGLDDFRGVFRSDDAGLSWTAANTGLGQVEGVTGFAFDPRNPQALWAATLGGVFVSTSRADSWSASSTGISTPAMTAIAMDPADSQTLWASSNQAGVWKTTNGGAKWSQTALTAGVGSLALDAHATPRRLYAATNSMILRSDDGGASWGTTTLAVTADGFDLPQVAVDPTDGSRVFAADETGVFFSGDAGASWSRLDELTVPLHARALLVDATRTIWVGARSAGGLFRSP